MKEKESIIHVEGYASLFDRQDLAFDLVRRGAFSASLISKGASGVRMLFQHDASEPIGVWDSIREDHQGLWVKGRVFSDVPLGRTASALVRRRAIDGLSIGFRTRRARKQAQTRELLEVELWEVSIVTFPMLPQARLRIVNTSNRFVANPVAASLAS
ncbi:MAG: HK97 family phage prohead protease [Robiginitomaculum sp.]|nr:MAG: HK97 family phage prohead protease [Robiginitomaculum sp.]